MNTNTNPDLLKVIENNPDLTTHGYGVDLNWGNDFATERENLKNQSEEFLISCEWLSLLKRTKSPNKRVGTSYHLKHMVERWADEHEKSPTYISEGAFVAAAIHLGFVLERIPAMPNVYLNISNRSKIDGQWI